MNMHAIIDDKSTLEKRALDRMTQVRTNLIMQHRFFGSLALKLQLKAVWWLPTMGVDGTTLAFNPQWVMSKTFDEALGVVAHEVMHCALGHMYRMSGRDHAEWNVACDYAINPMLLDAGFTLPTDGLIDKRYSGLSADDIYAQRLAERRTQPEGGSGDKSESEDEKSDEGKRGNQQQKRTAKKKPDDSSEQQQAGGDDTGDSKQQTRSQDKSGSESDDGSAGTSQKRQDATSGDDSQNDSQRGERAGDASSERGGGTGPDDWEDEDEDDDSDSDMDDESDEDSDSDMDEDEDDSDGARGSGSERNQSRGMEDDPDAQQDYGSMGNFSAPKDATGNDKSASDQEEEARDWEVAINQALSAAKRAGDMPGTVEQLFDQLRHPVVDWREQLKRFMSASAHSDYRWIPPNKRFVGSGMYLPSLTAEGMGTLVFAIDTSGSMNNDALQAGVDELNGVLADVAPEEVWIVQCDTKVHDVQCVTQNEYPLEVTAKGRGGTNFPPVFEKVAELGIEPACMVFFTDLETQSFPPEPPYPVLWLCQPSTTRALAARVPFGECILMADYVKHTP